MLFRALLAAACAGFAAGPGRAQAPRTAEAPARMSAGRLNAAAVRLRDGRIFVCGGRPESGTAPAYASAEIYDPTSNTWRRAAPMRFARYAHSAVLLRNGKVLVAGGRDGPHGDSLSSAEMYDPVKNEWSEMQDMPEPRDEHGSAVLNDGRVLVFAGYQAARGRGRQLDTAAIYDPRTNAWTEAARLSSPRSSNVSGSRLRDGGVLTAGGDSSGNVIEQSAEIYDPGKDVWRAVSPMSEPRQAATQILLADGRVLVAGGNGGDKINDSADIYDPATDR